jgi:arylsulfatase A-like enzyme
MFGLLAGLLVVFGSLSTGRQVLAERRALAKLPPAPGARNVLLIVWDTVRAQDVTSYGYTRDTTPNLARWARTGVRYDFALAPAPWTLPSHSSLFTGRWPSELNTQCADHLDASTPTLAEYLAARGYQTAGFAANTSYASWESGLDRGFLHYEDYVLSPWTLLGRSLAGNWVLRHGFGRRDVSADKWVRLQSRDARGINEAFLTWLDGRRRDRPFFAFLNYFDAHAPYFPGPGTVGRFGVRPAGRRDYDFLAAFQSSGVKRASTREVAMLHDCYDDCLAYLDEQLGQLLERLRTQGLLDNTLVIITSDHGEAFGDHGLFGHKSSVFLDQVWVPLVAFGPGAPGGREVPYPVSLRDVPATVVDQLELSAGAPFPGQSLAAYWRLAPGESTPTTSPALSEFVDPAVLRPSSRRPSRHRAMQMSLVARGQHYLRDGAGNEQLYELSVDPYEQGDLARTARGETPLAALEEFRRRLLRTLRGVTGAPPVEAAYLRDYRQELERVVEGGGRSPALLGE